MPENQGAASSAAPKRQLTLFDSTCIIVGIIIGAGIYQTAPMVARGAGHWWGLMLLWLLGGLLSLCGAMNYAELATAYPREGGDYIYLTRAYGRWAGFLFGWIQLTLDRPGSIAGMAFIFATYARTLYDPLTDPEGSLVPQIYAAGAVVLLTAINIYGARAGARTQNTLTVLKALGLLGVVAVGLFGPHSPPTVAEVGFFPLSVALILVLFSYGGWNDMVYVAAEVKKPERNLVRALLWGTGAVIVLYLLINGAFLHALGYSGLANSEAVATDTIATMFPEIGSRLIAILICISTLGVVNGQVFTGARISYAVGADHWVFRPLGKWSGTTGTPLRALVVQAAIAVALILILGSFIDTIIYTAAAVYLFYMATSLAVIVLRWKEPEVERPYRVTGYPIPTLVFAGVCGYLIYSAIDYSPRVSSAALGIVLLGLPLYWLTTPKRQGETS